MAERLTTGNQALDTFLGHYEGVMQELLVRVNELTAGFSQLCESVDNATGTSGGCLGSCFNCVGNTNGWNANSTA